MNLTFIKHLNKYHCNRGGSKNPDGYIWSWTESDLLSDHPVKEFHGNEIRKEILLGSRQ